MNIDTGIDLEKLVDAGTYICNVLEQPRRSKAGVALAAGGGAGGSSKQQQWQQRRDQSIKSS